MSENEPTTSIWGDVQWSKVLAPGIVLVSTASHGGIILDAQHTVRVPREIEPFHGFRNSWEEDCDVAVPLLLFAAEIAPQVQAGFEMSARAALADYKPEWLKAIDAVLDFGTGKTTNKGGWV